jgi:hypothetical protein
MVFHAQHAVEDMMKDPNVEHMCEYMLLIDKVKNPLNLTTLWETATAHNYHDFSTVFTHDEYQGWPVILQTILDKQKDCASSTKENLQVIYYYCLSVVHLLLLLLIISLCLSGWFIWKYMAQIFLHPRL